MFFFFFNDTATTEIYTLSLHDALPIYGARERHAAAGGEPARAYERSHHAGRMGRADGPDRRDRRLPPSAFRRHATASRTGALARHRPRGPAHGRAPAVPR